MRAKQQDSAAVSTDVTIVDRLSATMREILSNRRCAVGLTLLTPIITLTILAPIIAPYSPTETHTGAQFVGPGGKFLLGTDNLGRDLFSRVLYGGRSSLTLGVAATGLAMGMGVPIGVFSGYTGGRVDETIMRLMDTLMSIPSLLFALLIVAMMGSSLLNAMFAIAAVYTPRIARVVRSSMLSVTQEAFIKAAEARGESRLYICFREILPNITSTVIVEGSIRVGFAILIGASLSFLGLGTQPPTPDWGYMISAAYDHLWSTIWYWLWPSVWLGATILGFNLLGDGLRDVLDPQMEGSEGI